MTMGAELNLFVVGAIVISSVCALDVNRHLVLPQRDARANFAEAHSAQDVATSGFEYRSAIGVSQKLRSVNTERIRPENYKEYHNIAGNDYVTESDHVALLSKKISSNNIGNSENGLRLRTNVDLKKNVEFVEYTTVETRVDSPDDNLDIFKPNSNIQGSDSRLPQSHLVKGLAARDDLYTRGSNRFKPSITVSSDPVLNHDERAKTNINVNSEHPRYQTQQVNVPSGIDHVRNQNIRQDSVNVRPIDVQNLENPSVQQDVSQGVKVIRTEANNTVDNKEVSQRLPKGNGKEEIPWVWGSDPDEKKNTTEPDLTDRVAFDGGMCPTDYVKVMGVCVEKH